MNGFTVLDFQSIDSTNEEVKRQLQSGREGGFAVWARSQQAGRGRYGRGWESPEGNLYLSLALRTGHDMQRSAQLSFIAALAVGGALNEMLGAKEAIHYKWPNDVLLGGKKVAGILLESSSKAGISRPDSVIVGIGVNISHFPEETRFPATSLRQYGGELPSDPVRECLQIVLKHFTQWQDVWNNQGLLPVKAQWLAQSFGRGEAVKADTGNTVYHGIFEDLTDTGELVLKEEDGTLRYITAGEVFFQQSDG